MAMPMQFSANITALCREGGLKEALHILLTTHNPPVNSSTYVQLLQTCISKQALSECKQIHSHIKEREFEFATHKLLQNTLIRVYEKCGSLVAARQVFDQMTERDVFSWNAIIAAYRRHGCSHEALTMFHQMQQTRVQPDQFTFATILPTCAKIGDMELGMGIHEIIIESGFLSDVVVASALVDMYVKCGSIFKACQLFNRMHQRDVVSWTTMIAGYAQNGFIEKALETYKQMQLANIKPSSTTFASILPVIAKMGALDQGIDIHQNIMEMGFLSNVIVANSLIDMYSKCGRMYKARELFDNMPQRDVVSWTTMIGGYAQNGFFENALETFKQMQLAGVKPNSTTFTSILPACAQLGALEHGMDIHQSIMERGLLSDVVVVNALIDMYGKCQTIHKARELFDTMPEKNVVTWNSMIAVYAQNSVLDEALRLFYGSPQKDIVSWNTVIAIYAQNGLVVKALEAFKQMQSEGVKPVSTTFASILQACAKMRALEQGRDIHRIITERGFSSDVVVANTLVDMYAKCGNMHKACELFDKILQKNMVSWTAIIAGYTQSGYFEKALETFKQMQLEDVKPDTTTFISILPACAKMGALEQGMDVHRSIIKYGIFPNIVVTSTLVDMYAKCGSINKACKLFDKIAQRDVVLWTAMITGYAQNGFIEKALEAFKQMELSGVKPNSKTFASILQACAKMGALEQGINIHQSVMEMGLLSDVVVTNALVDMYAKCGSVNKACKLFESMPQRHVASWNAMISGYAQNGFVDQAIETYKHMQLAGVNPVSTTFVSILQACAKMEALEHGMDMHEIIMEKGLFSDVVVANALVDMYAKCGSIHKARELFDLIPQKNMVSWNAMIAGYAQNGVLDEALRLFKETPIKNVVSWTTMISGYAQNRFVDKALETFMQMKMAGVKPDSKTFASILPACAKMGNLEQGMNIHQSIIQYGFMPDVIVVNAMIDMYAKCRSIHNARELFDNMPQRDVVSWNVLIAGCVQNGFIEQAVEAYKQMQLAGVKPDSTSFASILSACAKMQTLQQGMEIHQSIIESGSLSNVVSSALLDMYAKCGSIQKARVLFDKMPQRDVVSWTVMISGYSQNGFVEKALETFNQMQLAGVRPNSATFASILPACAKMGALEQGVDIHQNITESGFLSDVVVASSLVDMYAKCGSIQKARELFDKMPERNTISWNAMIVGYAQNGFCKDSLKLFELMKHSGTHPDHVSFACVLLACSHTGLVDEGCKYFSLMNDSYCITPTIDHYACMVDILGRAGYLEETLNFIIKMPIKSVMVVWVCFLSACRAQKNLGLGVFTANLLFELDSKNAATYVLLSNIYAEGGRWDEVQMVRRLMKDKEIKKIPGCSWIEGHKMVHAFCVGDRSHPQTQEIYAKLEQLSWEMKAAGYIADSRHVLNDVEGEEKELFLCHHSEKLAIAFGLLNAPPGTTIRVIKNLRVCVDCHTATKFISKVAARQIIVRDASRFHHFKEGECSCGDFW
ncbi:pentatricopeptide repeat-containing protein At4g30700-like [Cryptomeria japonica]|uniref:pentatricopeptide repeat-containing protein At4g30700-like n=1 Tax=Cryptomeria japonica TaxID=3369 RepID=UPI0027DA0077|nr:pentatricopeptide repeat-containing protein At4g30700-like [Cryptomeria japonica]